MKIPIPAIGVVRQCVCRSRDSQRFHKDFIQIRGFSWLNILLIALASILVASPARALTCLPCISHHVAPTAADSQVPSNTKIWTDTDCTGGVLTKQGGMPVSISLFQIGDVQVLQPDTELEIGATYELTDCNGDPDGVLTSFTVGTGPDTKPPLAPIFEAGETEQSSDLEPLFVDACGKTEIVQLDVITDGSMLVLDIARHSTFDANTMSGAPVDFFFPNESALVGRGGCTQNWNFDEKGDAVGTRLGAFDLAGNFSGMSETQTIDLGCSYVAPVVANSTRYAWMMVCGVVWVRLRRKRSDCAMDGNGR